MSKENIEAVLQTRGTIALAPVGDSMRPFLRPCKDVVMLETPKRRLEKYDVILYRRGGMYVLHRIVGKSGRGYQLCGDNQTGVEQDVQLEQILAVAEYFYRGERMVRRTDLGYRLYLLVWCRCWIFRKVILRMMRGMKRRGRRDDAENTSRG